MEYTTSKQKYITLFLRLASLGIMGDQFKASFKPLNTIERCDGPRGFREGPQLVPIMPRDASLRNIVMSFVTFGDFPIDFQLILHLAKTFEKL